MFPRLALNTILILAIIFAPVMQPAAVIPGTARVVIAQAAGNSTLRFIVTSDEDTLDAQPGDAVCADSSGLCTLRAAVMEANAHPGDDHIILNGGEIPLLLGSLEITDRLAAGSVEEKASIYCLGSDPCIRVASDAMFYNLLIQGGDIVVPPLGGADNKISLSLDDCGLVYGGISTWNTNLTITGGTFQNGGGIFADEGSVLVIQNATVTNNRESAGAGIHGWGSSVFIYNSTISGNSAPLNKIGGGIHVDLGTLTVVNSTISGNQAGTHGGGILVSDADATIINSTITQNHAGAGAGGGLVAQGSSTIHLAGTIIAGNGALQQPDCGASENSAIISNGYNLIGDTTGCAITPAAGDLLDQEAGLVPVLADIGGPTLTHGLKPGSPAIDAGNPAGCADMDGGLLAYDQRIFPRAQDGNGDGSAICDIGAVEALPVGSPGLWECQDASTPNACHDSLVVDMLSASNGWAVGSGGAMLRWNGKVWAPDTRVDKAYQWYNLDLLSASEGWAVGVKMGTGQSAVAQWDGTQWTESALNRAGLLTGVSALPGGEAWALGGSAILRRAGGIWVDVPNPLSEGASLADIKMVSPDLGWAVGSPANPGDPAPVLRWNGSAWNVVTTPFSGTLSDVDAPDADSMWAVGQNTSGQAALLHGSGSNWSIIDWPLPEGGASARLTRLAIAAPEDIWAVGVEFVTQDVITTTRPLLLHFDGDAWTQAAISAQDPSWLFSLAMSAENDGWMFGSGGAIWRWNGNAWLPHAAGFRDEDYTAVERLSPRLGWISGPSFAMNYGMYWDSMYPLDGSPGLNDMDFLSPDSGWGVDEDGTIYRFAYDGWEISASAGDFLNSVDALAEDNAWAAGRKIFHWDGAAWTESLDPGQTEIINSLEMVSASDGWAAGTKIWRWGGSAWNQMDSPLAYPITGLDMLTATDGWAVGQEDVTHSAILHWDGTSWSRHTSVNTPLLKKISMVAEDDGWAITTSPSKGGGPGMDMGRIYHWDGITWSEAPHPAHVLLTGLSMEPSGSGYAVARNGIVLNFTPNHPAQTFLVTKAEDTLDGACDIDCSLREAAWAANAHPGFDTIQVPSGTYQLSIVPAGGEPAGAAGGLIINDDVEIDGDGINATQIDGGAISTVFTIFSFDIYAMKSINVALSDLTIRNGANPDPESAWGGGINSSYAYLVLQSVAVRDCSGPGLWVDGGSASIHNSLITNNDGGNWVGGVRASLAPLTITNSTISNNRAGWGGISSDVEMQIIGSTISGNTGNSGPGGIRAVGSFSMLNSTVSGNHGASGAGIWTNQGAALLNSTISGNAAVGTGSGMFDNGQGGGLYFYGDGETGLINTVIAGNTSSAGSPDCYGPLTSEGYNLIGTVAGCGIEAMEGDLFGIPDPRLGPLADNGGPTFTQALLPGSPAIDRGNDVRCLPVDQRGADRPQYLQGAFTCDIGAYELQTLFKVFLPFAKR